MDIKKIKRNLIQVTVSKDDCDLDEYYDNLFYLESRKILTFGDINFRIFEKEFRKIQHDISVLDLCLEDDKSIGLEMPNTWYLNKGEHALSIASYYNYLNWREIVEKKDLETFNRDIVEQFGRVSCIEVYLENNLTSFLKNHSIDYFGVPKTLTECIRYLEGWDLEKYPRLKGYATYAKFIELWSSVHFPNFNAKEWYLGKEESKKLNIGDRYSNVRKAVKFFWQNHLLQKPNKISEEDIEIDILGGKFSDIRQPEIILISEDIFSKYNSNYQVFKNLTKMLNLERVYISKLKNDFPIRNAEMANLIYPNTMAVVIEAMDDLGKNFTLMNPIKQSINTEIIIVAKILRLILEEYFA